MIMFRKLAFLLVMTMFLLAASEASAIEIDPTDYTGFAIGSLELGPVGEPFFDNDGDELEPGELTNKVRHFFNGEEYYTYIHDVDPWANNNTIFQTGFKVGGFAGVAGWRFSDAAAAGGVGDESDFSIVLEDGILSWTVSPGSPTSPWWDLSDNDEIRFFYTSFNPPAALKKDYLLTAGGTQGSAESWAPTPEPGSMLLLGSGLAALYGARRRRSHKG
jgi:hypothetical protein